MGIFLISSSCKINLRRLHVNFSLDLKGHRVIKTKIKNKLVNPKVSLLSYITFCQPFIQMVLEKPKSDHATTKIGSLNNINFLSIGLLLGEMMK